MRSLAAAIFFLSLLVGGCDRPAELRPVSVSARSAVPVAIRPAPSMPEVDACAILDQLDSDPDAAVDAIVASPGGFARAAESDCVTAALDTLARRFRRDEDERWLDAIALVWRESDGDVAAAITMDVGVMLLDEAFDATLDYLFDHRDQNDMESAILEAAVAIIGGSDDPMAEMSAFREDFLDHAKGRSREERRYLSGLLRRIVARATFHDQRNRGRTI